MKYNIFLIISAMFFLSQTVLHASINDHDDHEDYRYFIYRNMQEKSDLVYHDSSKSPLHLQEVSDNLKQDNSIAKQSFNSSLISDFDQDNNEQSYNNSDFQIERINSICLTRIVDNKMFYNKLIEIENTLKLYTSNQNIINNRQNNTNNRNKNTIKKINDKIKDYDKVFADMLPTINNIENDNNKFNSYIKLLKTNVNQLKQDIKLLTGKQAFLNKKRRKPDNNRKK